MAEIKIIVADEHPLFLEGICSLLKEEPGIEVKGACSIKEVMLLLNEFNAEVILLDLGLISCNGTTIPKLVHKREEKTSVLIMSNSAFDNNVVEILRVGAKGFISKSISKVNLLLAIKTIAKGDYYICKEVIDIIIENLSMNGSVEAQNSFSKTSTLSNREKDILKYISFGFTNSEIAEKLFISSHTVATHRRNLLQKINVKNTAGLVRYASKLGLLN